jgi:hypothetical protein
MGKSKDKSFHSYKYKYVNIDNIGTR